MGALADLRARVAAALAPQDGDGWDVHDTAVDAIVPPAFMLLWSEPWLVPATHCSWTARLDVVAISNRFDVGSGVENLETLVEVGLKRLAAAGLPSVSAGFPGRWDHGGITYLAARLTLNHPVTL
jgi:hypothetical protein